MVKCGGLRIFHEGYIMPVTWALDDVIKNLKRMAEMPEFQKYKENLKEMAEILEKVKKRIEEGEK